MEPNPIKELLIMEYSSLREELRGLKNCQVNFVTFAVTATGAVLGLASGENLPKAMAYMAPLLILLPTWSIFFDKATSINRIVGYMRKIEEGLLITPDWKNFRGWENNLANYRHHEKQLRADPSLKHWRPRHVTKYHAIVFLTYILLIALCLSLSRFELKDDNATAEKLWFGFLISAILTSLWNSYVFVQLAWVKYSSRAAYNLWDKVLSGEAEAENTNEKAAQAGSPQ